MFRCQQLINEQNKDVNFDKDNDSNKKIITFEPSFFVFVDRDVLAEVIFLNKPKYFDDT